MKIVVMIPAYNEEQTIGDVIRGIPRDCAERVEVLVIDDGSTDNTVEVSYRAGADKVISHNGNKGLGIAFSTGLTNALKMGADIIVNIDADGQFNPGDIPRLTKPIIEGEADMVTCSRFLDKGMIPKMPWIKKFGNNIVTKIVNFLIKQNYTDTQCGFRAYSKDAALKLTIFSGYTYTQEVFLDLINKNCIIKEIPCKVKGERNGKSRVVNNFFSYGVKVLIILIRTFRDNKPLEFFGSIGLITFSIGFVSGLFLIIRWFLYHVVSPYRSLVSLSALLLTLGFLLLFLALIADMSDRERKILEEILYRLRKNELSPRSDGNER